jgi:hypothetical protein
MMKVLGGLGVCARRKRHFRFQDNQRELARSFASSIIKPSASSSYETATMPA